MRTASVRTGTIRTSAVSAASIRTSAIGTTTISSPIRTASIGPSSIGTRAIRTLTRRSCIAAIQYTLVIPPISTTTASSAALATSTTPNPVLVSWRKTSRRHAHTLQEHASVRYTLFRKLVVRRDTAIVWDILHIRQRVQGRVVCSTWYTCCISCKAASHLWNARRINIHSSFVTSLGIELTQCGV